MKFTPAFAISLALWISALSAGVHATGVQPDTTILLISQSDSQAQMVVRNTEDIPVLLNVQIIDLPEDNGVTLLSSALLERLEPGGRQVVRFFLDKSTGPLTVQHMKRVSFEGIPGRPAGSALHTATVRVNVRQVIPVVISPAGLEQDNEPWKHLVARKIDAQRIEISNPSAYVVRLSADAIALPGRRPVKILDRTYILPGEKFDIDIAHEGAADAVAELEIAPASPWGYQVPPYRLRVGP